MMNERRKWVKITMSIDRETAENILELKNLLGVSWNDILESVQRAQTILNTLQKDQNVRIKLKNENVARKNKKIEK